MSLSAVTYTDIVQASRLVKDRVHRTPLFRSRLLNALCGADLCFKGEHLQRTGSFKVRGAFNRLLNLSEEERRRGVVAFSSGNHGQAVALAGRELACPVTLVMPTDAPRAKRDAARHYGAEIVTYERALQDRETIAREIADARGAVLVPPFDHPLIIAGQGTLGIEFLEQAPDLDAILVPVGGGGLISGIAIALHALNPSIEIIGVEPAVGDKAERSLKAGKRVRIAQPRTIADGVATRMLGRHTFPIIRSWVSTIAAVEEDAIVEAWSLIVTRMKQVIEPTAALTTAALLSGAVRGEGRKLGVIFCGGNVDLSDRRLMKALADV